MEWTTMNKDDANESLLSLIGELLYKNQLLREAIASKDEAIELIIKHLMSAATSACSCGVANQLTFVRNTVNERDVELARRKRYCFNEFCNIAKYLIDSATKSAWDAAIRTAEK
jgi:histone H3/H4